MLELRGVESYYGSSQVLFGVDLEMQVGEVVTLLGRNGMGKTTTIRSIMGLTPAARGSIRFEGKEIRTLPSYAIARLGFGLVPEGRQIFPNLTLRENLLATAANYSGSRDPYTLKRLFSIFPRLADRVDNYGNQLSGGEQQMLAIGRGLMSLPKLLMLDEPSLGLAPILVKQIFNTVKEINATGTTILLVEQNVFNALDMAVEGYVFENGRMVLQGKSQDLLADAYIKEAYLGV